MADFRKVGVSLVQCLALIGIVGCAAARPGFPEDPPGARTAILAVSREFSSLYERGDAAAMAALYTADGVILPPGRATMSGVAALTRYWTLAPGARVLEHHATPDSIVVVGTVAYDWGTYRVRTRDAAGAERDAGGKYVIVWRETGPGVWRMHLDMWNAGPTTPPATPRGAAPARGAPTPR